MIVCSFLLPFVCLFTLFAFLFFTRFYSSFFFFFQSSLSFERRKKRARRNDWPSGDASEQLVWQRSHSHLAPDRSSDRKLKQRRRRDNGRCEKTTSRGFQEDGAIVLLSYFLGELHSATNWSLSYCLFSFSFVQQRVKRIDNKIMQNKSRLSSQ